MKLTLPKGMRDISAEEMSKREYVYAKIRDVLVRYGFSLVEPSALENLETLVAKSGPAIEQEIYSFEDKSKRKIGLRFDLTVGMARMVASTEMPKPVRLACISNMWRYDNPQYARYRSFWQWDAEVYGCDNPIGDAEIISMTSDILESFGLDFEIRVSSRKLVEGMLLGIGVASKDVLSVMRAIDKMRRLSESEAMNELLNYVAEREQAEEILDLCKSGTTIEKLKQSMPNNELAAEGLTELEKLFELLKSYKKADKCVLDLSIVRGIDYYTGIVYEAWVKGEEGVGAIAGGGRYDDLMGIYGKEMPATGIAGGVERLLLSLEKNGLLPEAAKQRFFLAYATPDVFFQALEILRKARESGMSIVMDMNRRDLRKQFEYANKLGVQFVLVAGKKELESKKLRLRDMKSGEEKDIGINELESLKTA